MRLTLFNFHKLIYTTKEAVEGVVEISEGYCKGLHALKGEHRNKVKCKEPRDLTGSICLDKALKEYFPDEPRWDYGIGLKRDDENDCVVWIEVHPSSSKHVQDVLNKLAWLREWLTKGADTLNKMTRKPHGYVWVSSGKVALQPTTPQRRRIAAAGIHFAGESFAIDVG